jgi:hypothetical protein
MAESKEPRRRVTTRDLKPPSGQAPRKAAVTIATVAFRSQWTVIQLGAAHPMIGTYSDGKSTNVSWLSNLSPVTAE